MGDVIGSMARALCGLSGHLVRQRGQVVTVSWSRHRCRHFGLADRPRATLAPLSRDVHLSRERVWQIAIAALEKLQHHLASLAPSCDQHHPGPGVAGNL